ncbi:MAG: TerB family tellurite resistance protein [Prevotella sp.]|nr:TerB family tellurite resistance protein [Prevotella sp.]
MEINAKRKAQFLDLYAMVTADGIVHPKELETLYRIGTETYGLTQDEMTDCVKSSGISSVIPELPEERVGMLYQMALIAWADGELETSERNLLRRYAVLYGVNDEDIDELVDFLLQRAKDNVKEADVIKELNS